MKSRRAISVTASIIVALTSSLNAQWLQTSGPFGGYVADLAASGSNLLAGAGSGVFYSTDDGSHWSPSLSVPGGATALVTGGNSRVWAGVSQGIFLSTNDGVSWSDVTTGMVNDHVNAMAAGPSEALASEYGGLFRSTDLGITWVNIGAGLPATNANALLIDGGVIWVGLQNSPHALYRSSDVGGSWQYSDSGLVPKDVRSILRFGGKLFSSTWGGGVFVSGDNGVTWTPANNGIVGSIVQRLYVFGKLICASSDYGVFISADTGITWKATGDLPMSGYGSSGFASMGPALFWGGADGVHASTDTGAVWTLRNTGMTGAGVPALVSMGGALAAGTYYNGVAVSTDGGTSWNYSNAGLPGHIIYTLQSSGNLLWEGGNIGVYRSTDNGANWASANNGFGSYNPTYGFISQPPLLYSCGSIGVFVSGDSGASWTKISTGLPVKPVYSMLLVSPSGPTIMAGTYDTLYRSSDGGGGWTPVRKAVAEKMTRFGNDIYAATQSGIMISTDEGVTWNSANQNINPLSCNAFAISGNNLFLGASAGLFRTTGRGVGWTDLSSGLPQGGVSSLLVEGSYLYAGVGFTGVWKRALAEIVTDARSAGPLPVRAALEQNYPNPFNPSTTIRYSLPDRSDVMLTVSNTLGQQVAVLVNGIQNTGNHEVRFDGSGLASGVYFYRLRAGSLVQTKKFVILR
jgi:hypothetical protein